MQNRLDLSPYVGKVIKVVFREAPSTPIEVRKGKLADFDRDFIQLQTFENVHLINRLNIISLKVFGCEEMGVR